jgi:hypothetical protein
MAWIRAQLIWKMSCNKRLLHDIFYKKIFELTNYENKSSRELPLFNLQIFLFQDLLQKGCTRLTAASDKVYQLLAHVRWFSSASSTTKTGRHDIAEILLKVALSTTNQIKH